MTSEFDRDQLLDIFVAEAGDDMKRFWTALHPEGKGHPEPREVAEFHAVGHKLKGAALLYGFAGLGQLGGLLEETLEQVKDVPVERWPAVLQVIRDIVTSFRTQVEHIGRGGGEDSSVVEGFVRRCRDLIPAHSVDAKEPHGDSSDAPPEDYLIPAIDAEVLSYFSPEADEYLNTIHTLLQRLEADLRDPETTHQLYRVAHTLKGSAYTVGFQVVGDIAHPIEACLIAVREGHATIAAHWIPVMRQAVQVIRSLLERDPHSVPRLRQDVPVIKTLLRELEVGAGHPSAAVCQTRQAEPSPVGLVTPPPNAADSNVLAADYLIPNLDAEVMSYFAPEAQEYLESLEADLLRIDQNVPDSEAIHQLFRTAHTLKGSAHTVGFQAIGDLTHHIEDFMGAVREGHLQLLPGHTDVLLRAIDVIRALMRRDSSILGRTRQRFAASLQELKQLGKDPSTSDVISTTIPMASEVAPAEEKSDAVETESSRGGEGKTGEEREVIRVSRERLERLLNLVGELVIDRGRLEQRLRTLDQLASQVVANKNRLTDAVRTFEDKHTFSF